MLTPRMMRVLPLRIDDRTLPDLHNAVAGGKPSGLGSIDELYMRPLVTMMVNVVCNFAEQYSFILEHSKGLSQKQWKRMREGVAIFLGGLQDETKSLVEIFFVVLTLIWDMRRIIYNNIELTVLKEIHVGVVPDEIRLELRIDV